ncbi:MAG: hypothetical protein ACTSPQ_18425 [Candidatus Helarchaeota archaeon]
MVLKQKFYGICEICHEPLGFVENDLDNVFCYNCSGYEKRDISESISFYNNRLNELRILFRNEIIKSNIWRYFFNYIEFGEAIVSSEEEDYLTLYSKPYDSYRLINFKQFVVANIGIKWILEDLLFFERKTDDYQDEICIIPLKWLLLFQKKIYLENNLGFLILDKKNTEKFYFFEKLNFYHDSLKQFGLIPRVIDSNEFQEIKNDLLKKEKNLEYVRELVNIHLPIYFVCMAYLQYPNIEDRIFSFEDILYTPKLIDYIGIIIDTYKNQVARNQNERNNGRYYFKIIPLNQLKKDTSKIKWTNNLENHIITSKFNPMSFPMLINIEGNSIIITPTRLKIAREMMFERFSHNIIHKFLSIKSERMFLKEILNKLKSLNCIFKDPKNNKIWINISDKKRSTFEFDVLAIFNKNIFIIESKSFHPSPFYYLKNAVYQRKERVAHFNKQFTKKIKPWILKHLQENNNGNYIRIKCRIKNIDKHKSEKCEINIPKLFNNIADVNIIGLFITQYKEYFLGFPQIYQIYIDDLQSFISGL